MTKDRGIDKDRDDFSHNYTPIRIKCPECMRVVKGSNHVRVYKNLAGLWRHIKLEHGQISNLIFDSNQIREILTHIARGIKLGILPSTNGPNRDTTTSLSLLYKGKPLRRDMNEKLKEISRLMQGQTNLYPIFTTENLFTYVRMVLEHADERTIQKYFYIITNNSVNDNQNGTYDVSGFCEKL